MTISLLTLTLLLGATSLGVAQQIDSPRALIQCQPVDLTFSEGQAPYAIDGEFTMLERRRGEGQGRTPRGVRLEGRRGEGV